MKKQIKQQLVKALKSGKYTKAQGTLRKENNDGTLSHCCIGVLCDLYRKQVKKSWDTVIDGDDCNASDKVVKWAGLSGSQEGKLVFLNDKTGTENDNYAGVIKHLTRKH